jgi:hypothetical protein
MNILAFFVEELLTRAPSFWFRSAQLTYVQFVNASSSLHNAAEGAHETHSKKRACYYLFDEFQPSYS